MQQDSCEKAEANGVASPSTPSATGNWRSKNLVLMQDALRNVPGVTLNSGEGGAHGDSVNLRGLSIPDSFFLDGVRDIGQYQRDTFNTDAISQAAM